MINKVYEPVAADMDFVGREADVLKFWKENDIFKKSVEMRKDADVFTFYDGPPTANGMPHIGHVLTRSIKDIIPRYKSMRGYNVLRKAGWDTHGLPVELEVEKSLGLNGKADIERHGVEDFIRKCKESVWRYKGEWEAMSDKIGFWADMDDPYVTYHDSYIESVWWALKTIWDKGLIYKGAKVVPYCPRCGTALSSHEVAQGYKDVKEKSAIAKFKLAGKDEYILAWTTTPWTLPSNVALCVNPAETYVRAQSNGEVFILAEALAGKVLPEGYEVLETFTGKTLEYREYEPLFGFAEVAGKANIVVCDEYVTLTDGTGIVHQAPAFGEDDARVGRKYGLQFIQLVDASGKMTEEAKPFAGMFVKDADPHILKWLLDNNKLFAAADYEHNYPFCWRCDTALIYYARSGWFIEMTKVREQLMANNNTVNWLPDNIRTGRFGNFLENVVDWAVSRERYWGTPMPVWLCDCGYQHCVGSIAELNEMGGSPQNAELHKPYIDNVYLTCPKCTSRMTRTPEVIDCWFDAGSMPFAQWNYIGENGSGKSKELFAKYFPADFISEGIDQTRGWFYTLMAISTLLFGKSSFKNCVVTGHVNDKDGKKLSKRLKNYADPMELMDKYGADSIRWYFYHSSQPWLPYRFHEDVLSEGQRKFMGTLWNTYAFYVLYANIDGFDAAQYTLETANLPLMDRWVLSRLNNLVKYVTEHLDEYKITEAARALGEFVDELSNWYVRRCRERYWGSGIGKDKTDAYMTLYTVLASVVKLAAPFTPFMAESVYRNLCKNGPVSVHLCDYPVYDERLTDHALESGMGLVMQIVYLGRAARSAANIKTRQPVANMMISAGADALDGCADYTQIIKDELNVKSIEFISDASLFTTYTFKPQLKTLGPKYGKLLGKISAYLSAVDGNAFMAQLKGGGVRFDIDGAEIELTIDDVLYETAQTEGYSAAADKGVAVVIDTRLTPELIEEGFVREIISKLQTMRKEAGFEVTDKINVYHETGEALRAVFGKNAEYIKKETLASAISGKPGDGAHVKEWDINGEKAVLGVKKA